MQRSLKMMVARVLVVATVCLCSAATAYAQVTQPEARVALHAQTKAVKAITICSTSSPNAQELPCTSYNVGPWPAFVAADVYLVVAMANPGPGIAGVSCGVAADPNVGIFGWTLCSDLDFPSAGWPANGGGDRITWAATTNCQNTVIGADGVHAVGGAFYIYAYGDGLLEITKNFGLVIPELRVADCSASETEISTFAAAKVGFGTMSGYDVCNATPVESATWGAIKTLYNR